MKLESLTVIFLIIIIPIELVFSQYLNTKINTEKKELLYNTRLLNSTYDAIKSYQINTVNNSFGDITNNKVSDLEAAANSFFNSLANNFKYTGYRSSSMKEYVPAIAFTLYDGYYIYSPFTNILTEIKDEEDDKGYDEDFSKNNQKMTGLKTYVYYSCRYNLNSTNDFVITYTLDNYITIQGLINGEYVCDYGYLYKIATSKSDEGIFKDGDTYWYDGIQFKRNDTECLKEYVGNQEYSYIKINGKKYYLDENYYTEREDDKRAIFYIDDSGSKNYTQTKGNSPINSSEDNELFLKYVNAIEHNKSAYEYYKNAYEFSKAVLSSTTTTLTNYYDKTDPNRPIKKGYGLSNLQSGNAEYYDNTASESTTQLKEYGNFKIFDCTNGSMEKANSNFNKHRKSIIRYVVETNLVAAISGYRSKNVNVDEFIMPKISDENWDFIENSPCAIAFMQGMNLGTKKYNGYSVVRNTLSKEYIDENDIYILKTDGTYCTVNDNTLNSSNIVAKSTKGFYSGIWKVNFEGKVDTSTGSTEVPYIPIKDYIGSYSSIIGGYEINNIENSDMYTYVKESDSLLKKTYYMALGRERHCAFNINNINYETYSSNAADTYFLKDY